MTYKDCYSSFDGIRLTIGNKYTERVIELSNGVPISRRFTDKEGNKCWQGGRIGMFYLCDFDFPSAKVSYSEEVYSENVLQSGALTAVLCFSAPKTEIKAVFTVYPEARGITAELYLRGKYSYSEESVSNSAISGIELAATANCAVALPPRGTVDCFNISERHLKLETVRLFDCTDNTQELYTESEELLYSRAYKSFEGNVFTVTDTMTDRALLLVRECYTSDSGEGSFRIKPSEALTLRGNKECEPDEYGEFIRVGGATAVCSSSEDVKKHYRSLYSLKCGNSPTFIMSNTWGDRNRDSRICEKFILGEIERAAELGINVVQIDDGWQKGVTANSAFKSNLKSWGSYYSADLDFWEVNPEKFPRGLTSVADAAKQKGVELGLWFSLDSTDNYAMWDTDAAVILGFYRNYGIKHFKIDGLSITSPISENNILRFMESLYRQSNGEIRLNMDITAGRRLGYFLYPQYSTLFVENRYTDWGNYYPTHTLRALWSLSRILPSSRFQFELLNVQRNKDQYGDSDPLRPDQYQADYLLASVMVACPLAWMELSSLPESESEKLKRAMRLYKELREELSTSEVSPIGQRPNGFAHTGFFTEHQSGNGLAILLTEPLTEDECYTYRLPTARFSSVKILLTNDPQANATLNSRDIVFSSSKKCSYAICRLS